MLLARIKFNLAQGNLAVESRVSLNSKNLVSGSRNKVEPMDMPRTFSIFNQSFSINKTRHCFFKSFCFFFVFLILKLQQLVNMISCADCTPTVGNINNSCNEILLTPSDFYRLLV